MAATLAQIIGIEQGVRASTEQWWKLIRDALHKEQLLVGIDQRYEPEEGHLPQPPKRQRVQANVEQLLGEARERLARWWDVTATKDWGNMGAGGARADVILDGEVLLRDVPATFLLFLQKQLDGLASDIGKIPVQSLAEDWHRSTEPGIWRTEQEKRPSASKVTTWEQIVAPTDHHPADVRQVSKDVISGTWITVKTTSAPTLAWREATLGRIGRMREAVQSAIYDANKVEITDVHVAAPVLNVIFGGNASAGGAGS